MESLEEEFFRLSMPITFLIPLLPPLLYFLFRVGDLSITVLTFFFFLLVPYSVDSRKNYSLLKLKRGLFFRYYLWMLKSCLYLLFWVFEHFSLSACWRNTFILFLSRLLVIFGDDIFLDILNWGWILLLELPAFSSFLWK